MLHSSKQVSQSVAYTNPFYTVYDEEYVLADGEASHYYAIRGLQTSFVVPVLTPDTLILTKQFRYLYQEYSWEFPAGRVDPGETMEEAALRELNEEAGYKAGTLHYAGWFAPCNGLTDEQTHVFVATDLQLDEQNLDATEQIEVHQLQIDEFVQMIENNTARDGMTIAAWGIAKPIIKQLFS